MTIEVKADQKKLQQAETMARMGVYTVNEIRAFLGLPELGVSGGYLAKAA